MCYKVKTGHMLCMVICYTICIHSVQIIGLTDDTSLVQKYYRAMLRRALYCYGKSSVCPSVCLSVTTLRYRDRIGRNSSKRISPLARGVRCLQAPIKHNGSTPGGTLRTFGRKRSWVWKKWLST